MEQTLDHRTHVDGGYAWIILLACFCLYMINAGTTKSFGILYVDLLEYFGSSAAETAWIFSLQMFLFFGFGPIANYLVVRYSFRNVLFCGGLLISAAFLASSFVHEMHMLYLTMGAILGLGYGLVNTPITTIVHFYFEKRRALASSLVICGSGTGSFCFPYIYRALIDAYGIQGALILISGITLHSCVFSCLIRQPKEVNMDQSVTDQHRSYFQQFFNLSYFKIPTYTLYVIALFFNMLGYAGNIIVFPAHMKELGFKSQKITVAFSLIGVTELISRIAIGWFSDLRIVHPRTTLTLSLIISTIVPPLLPLFPYYSAMLAYACFIGIFPGVFWSLMVILILECVGLKRLPSAIGVLSLFLAIGVMLSQVLSGWLRDITGNWHMSLRVLSIFNGLTFILLLSDTLVRKFLIGKDIKMKGPNYMHKMKSDHTIESKNIDSLNNMQGNGDIVLKERLVLQELETDALMEAKELVHD